MHRSMLCALALAMASAAQAQDRGELEQLKRRVEELEKRSAPRSATSVFNPDISLILQGTAAKSSQNPDDYQITGFPPPAAKSGRRAAVSASASPSSS